MSVQARYDEFIEYVRDELESRNRRILRSARQWYEYRDGAWFPWSPADESSFETFLRNLSSLHEFPYATSHSSLWTMLRASFGSETVIEFDAEPMIVARNGTYFLRSGELHKHSPEHFATRRVAIDVDGDATCPIWEEMMERIFEDQPEKLRTQTIQFLQEWMGVAIVGGYGLRRELRKALFLWGLKRTGKSSLTETLTKLLGGPSRVASSSLTALSSRFGLEPLIGKSALITSEAANTKTEADSNVLKNLITGDLQTADIKGERPVPFQWHGPLVFTTNTLPKVHDDSSAFYDRCVVIEFHRQFSSEDADRDLRGHGDIVTMLEAEGELPGILNWALEGYDRAVKRGRYIIPESATSATERFRAQNDYVFDFLRRCVVADKKTACSSEALAIACVEYAQTEHDKRMSVAGAARAVSRAIAEVVNNVASMQGYHEKEQFRAYGKVRLTEYGMEMLKRAEGKDYPGLKKAMRRVNYAYG